MSERELLERLVEEVVSLRRRVAHLEAAEQVKVNPLKYGARVLLYGTQIIEGAWEPLLFTYELNDFGNCWSPADPGRLYAPVAGYYDIGGGFSWQNDQQLVDTRYILVGVRLNGASWKAIQDVWMPKTANDYLHLAVATSRVWMNAGDYAEIMTMHNIGASRTIGTPNPNLAYEHTGFGYIQYAAPPL